MERIVLTTVAAVALIGAGAAGAQQPPSLGWGGAGPTPAPAPTSGAAGEEFGYAPRDYNGSIDPNRRDVPAGSSGRTMTSPSAGPGGQGFSGSGGATGGDRVIARLDGVSGLDRRAGPSRTQLELRQTALLNTLASLDRVEAVRNLRRDGERYYADALTRGGGWQTVEMDPYAGTISTVR